MKLSILTLFFIGFIITLALANQESTKLTYFVQYEEDQNEDYIEVTLKIESQSRSLVQAIKNAKRVVDQISTMSSNYCKQNAKKSKGDCKEAVDVSSFQIQPKYQMVRKQATFSTFVVSHQVTVKVFNTENIGYLIDTFLKYSELTLEGFQWLPLQEKDSEEEAIKEGLEQGEGLCSQIGLSLGRVLDVEEIIEEDEAEKGGEQEDEQDAEQQPEITTYKFQVECVAKSKSKSK